MDVEIEHLSRATDPLPPLPGGCVIVRGKPERHEPMWLCRFHAMRSHPTMTTTQQTITARAAAPAAGAATMKWLGLAIAIALGLIILMMPTPTGLTVQGQRV